MTNLDDATNVEVKDLQRLIENATSVRYLWDVREKLTDRSDLSEGNKEYYGLMISSKIKRMMLGE